MRLLHRDAIGPPERGRDRRVASRTLGDMDRPPPDPAKLLEAWMEWEHGDVTPGRVMATLKTGGLRDLLEAAAAAGAEAQVSTGTEAQESTGAEAQESTGAEAQVSSPPEGAPAAADASADTW